MRYLQIGMPAILGLFLIGCVGGGGEEVIGGGNGGSTPPSATGLGSRQLPGYRLNATVDGPLSASTVRGITLILAPDVDVAAPTLVEAALGGTEPTAWIPGHATAEPLCWRWELILPSSLDGQRLWLRVTDADGNVAESGFADFALDQ